MITAAQIRANRANAQKSTGPRTAEGKALVARNAVKHGLLGEQTVVEGEDRLRFTRHRDEMLRALVPVGEVEVTLAERLIGLSWRLQRIERLQVQAFETLCAGPAEGPAGAGADEELTLGRIVVRDFSEARVLDKLLMYERRLEHSLCRMLGELRKEHLFQNLEARTMDEGRPQVLLERLMGKLQDGPSTMLRGGRGSAGCEETPAHDAWAEGAEEVAGLKCDVSSEESQSAEPRGLSTSDSARETPNSAEGRSGEGVSSLKWQVSKGSPALEISHVPLAAPEDGPDGSAGLPQATERVGQAATNGAQTPGPACERHPVDEGTGTGLPDVTSPVWGPSPGAGLSELTPDPRPLPPGFLRQTNPIGAGGEVGQVLFGAGVTDDTSPAGLGKTKPICPAPALAASGVADTPH